MVPSTARPSIVSMSLGGLNLSSYRSEELPNMTLQQTNLSVALRAPSGVRC